MRLNVINRSALSKLAKIFLFFFPLLTVIFTGANPHACAAGEMAGSRNGQSRLQNMAEGESIGYLYLCRNRIAREYIYIYANGYAERVQTSKCTIMDFKTGWLPDSRALKLFYEVEAAGFFGLPPLYEIKRTREKVYELDRFTLYVSFHDKQNQVIADGAARPHALAQLIESIYATSDHLGHQEEIALFIKCRPLSETVVTLQGEMEIGAYWQSKGRVFHRIDALKKDAPVIPAAVKHMNRFMAINQEETQRLDAFKDPRSTARTILLKSGHRFLIVEFFHTEGSQED